MRYFNVLDINQKCNLFVRTEHVFTLIGYVSVNFTTSLLLKLDKYKK